MAKQLFNSSEKSNFILNMTEEKYSKLASWGILGACFLVSLATAIPVISGQQLHALSSAGLALAGTLAMIIAMIGAIKKYIGKSAYLPLGIMGFMVLWCIVSTIFSMDVNISIYGFTGRGEGLLSLVFYACFFIMGICIKGEKSANTLAVGLIGTGLLNCIFGIIQIFTGKLSFFRLATMETEINAASGLSQSPLFLAVLLTFSLIAALMGFVFFEKKGMKIFAIVSACIFAFTIMFTYSFIGICGAVLAVIAVIIAIIVRKSPKINLASVLAVIVPAAVAVIIVQAGLIGNISSYRLYDGRILWFADSYYRLSASGEPDPKLVDLNDTYDVYYTLNRKTMDIISSDPLTGTGSEQLVFPQLYTWENTALENADINDIIVVNKGTFDKTYNEYLYIAATRGIPSTIALALLMIAVILLGRSNCKRSKKWQSLFVLMITASGALLFIICCSSTAFAPIFWTAAGLCCQKTEKADK